MPVATPEGDEEMRDRARRGAFAYPAIDVTSSQTLDAALAGFAEAESDGIVQVSTGGAAYWSGSSHKPARPAPSSPSIWSSTAARGRRPRRSTRRSTTGW